MLLPPTTSPEWNELRSLFFLHEVFSQSGRNCIIHRFLEDAMFSRLANECAKEGLWLLAILELGSTYGWREAELLGMRVSQVDLAQRIIRLEPGTTKNDEGREVEMTPAVFVLLAALMAGKEPEEYVFPREDGTPVREFAGTGGGLAQRLV